MKTLSLILLPSILIFSSCAPSTPQERILKNSTKFTNLPTEHQELVERGELARGMSADAVFLAWGSPSQRYQGLQGDIVTDRWDYSGSQPVVNNHFGINYGIDRGWGRRSSYSGFSFGPEIQYVPYREATVLFKNSKVDSWERMQ